MNIQELFKLGMKRDIPELVEPNGALALNLGAGNQAIPGATPLDYPAWDAEKDGIPYPDESQHAVYAFHFLEHLPGKRVIEMLREIERVLVPGGVANIVVPHRLSQMAYHDLDHKTFFCEETWRTLFSTPYYDKNREVPWHLKVGLNIVIGLNERNLALMTQLIKE